MRNKWSVVLLLCFVASFFLVTQNSCYYDKEDKLYPYSATCDTTAVTYSQTIQPIIDVYCYSCHSTNQSSINGGGVNLENFASLTNYVNNGNLICDIEHAGCNDMPQNGGKMPDCNILQIKVWKAAGTPNN